jgi:hypothetical protein
MPPWYSVSYDGIKSIAQSDSIQPLQPPCMHTFATPLCCVSGGEEWGRPLVLRVIWPHARMHAAAYGTHVRVQYTHSSSMSHFQNYYTVFCYTTRSMSKSAGKMSMN